MSKGPWRNKPRQRSIFRKKRVVNPNSVKALQEHRVPFRPNDPVTGEKDERINRKGLPRSTAEARRFFQEIGERLVRVKMMEDGKAKEQEISLLEKMVQDMYSSKAPLDHQTILKASFPGLLSDEDESTRKRPSNITLEVVYTTRTRASSQDVPEDVEEGEEVVPAPCLTVDRSADQPVEIPQQQEQSDAKETNS